MNNRILTILILILIIWGNPNVKAYKILSDSIVSKDSINKSKSIFKIAPEIETEIKFDEKKLAPINVRIIFNELFKQYIAVKDALVYGDSYNAVINTLKLLDDMKSKTKDVDILDKDDRWVLFLNNYEMIKKKVETTKFISEQRFLFNEITNGIIEFIKQYGLYDKTIYLYQCSDNLISGNGRWLSDKRNNKNPYLGRTNDTTCAKVKEVWKF